MNSEVLIVVFFFLLVCLVQLQCDGFSFTFLYFILLCFASILETFSFLKRDKKGKDLDEKGSGVVPNAPSSTTLAIFKDCLD